ncbi:MULTISPECIES: metallophosphoesterase [unclassified Sphingobacterium]|uniref:metallophosphoesterase n=1 Tax=unclassified Sphingobacterium TaxID=2609468 RepID=UPI0025D2346F|nr:MULTISPECIES: metallophosphoesterase [unclassified Sphingobacterium]
MIPQLYAYLKIIAIFLLLDILIYLRLRRLTVRRSHLLFGTIIWWTLNIAEYASIFLNLFFEWSNFFTALSMFFPISLLLGKILLLFFIGADVLSLTFKNISKRLTKKRTVADPHPNNKPIGRSDFILKSGILLSSIPLVALTRGFMFNLYDYQIKHIDLILSNLPKSFEGITIAQISDIHAGSLYDSNTVKKGVDLLLSQKPDMIFFTGDLVNDFAEEMDDYLSIFDKLKAPLGVFSILGNHDYGDYHFNRFHFNRESKLTKEQNLADVKDIHRKLGWHLLLNESKEISLNNEKITIIGVENWGINNVHNYGDLDLAMSKVAPSSPINLLLSHDPSHWRTEILPKYPMIDVTFSGHTHGGQFGYSNPDYQWSPIKYAYPEWAGLYQEKHQSLYVNVGFGYLDYPSRVGIMPEITIFHLKNKVS